MSGGRIELSRESGHHTDRLRAYKVLIDGRVVGSIKQGEATTFEVEPGSHEVQLRIAWCRSPTVALHAAPASTVRLRCRPNARPDQALYFSTVGRDRYIALYAAPPT